MPPAAATPKRLRRVLARLADRWFPRWRMRTAFTRHYRAWDWGEPESVSGPGSTLARTATIREHLPPLFAELRIRSVLDAGCGDFNWFHTLDVELESYIGTDVVRALVVDNQARWGSAQRSFRALDIAHDSLPRVDLVLCRDCLVHLPTADIVSALANIKGSGARYLLATTFVADRTNEDTCLGGWRPIDLERPPFGLGPPLRLISEGASVEDGRYADKSLGLWDLRPDLPDRPHGPHRSVTSVG